MVGLVLLVAMAVTACGGSDGITTSGARSPHDTAAGKPAAEPPEVAHPEDWGILKRAAGPYAKRLLIPQGPVPERVVIRDLKRGRGPVLQAGDEFFARYVGFTYNYGVEVEPHWLTPRAFTFQSETHEEDWERGLEGIRVGGMRELILPASMAKGPVARVYLVHVVKLDRSA